MKCKVMTNQKNLVLKICTHCYLDAQIKFEDFDLGNTLIDEESQENVLNYNILSKNFDWYKTKTY